MSQQRTEFRVVWQRVDRQRSTRIFQSWNAAYHKAQGILALEAVKKDTTYSEMPPLAHRPVIEQRTVGDWEPVGIEVNEPSRGVEENMLAHFGQPSKRDVADVFPF